MTGVEIGWVQGATGGGLNWRRCHPGVVATLLEVGKDGDGSIGWVYAALGDNDGEDRGTWSGGERVTPRGGDSGERAIVKTEDRSRRVFSLVVRVWG